MMILATGTQRNSNANESMLCTSHVTNQSLLCRVSAERVHRGKSKGFSLIEILVVLVIIAFATKMVVYSLDGGAEEELDTQALRLHTTINMASEFAILNQVELGIASRRKHIRVS